MQAGFSDYLEICKPRVVLLMLITVAVAMLLAVPGGQALPLNQMLLGILGIAFMSFAGGAVNHLVDRHLDIQMARTKNRPVATGVVSTKTAVILAALLTFLGFFILLAWVNAFTAWLSFVTLIGYAIIYTMFLKHATPQNIVIGGLAGAMPPMLGWAAITGHASPMAWILVAIIFAWTPPHFWALAIYRIEDYRKVEVPMLPVTHGIAFTKQSIIWYTIIMVALTYLPVAIGASGLIYVVVMTALNAVFIIKAIGLSQTDAMLPALKLFHYSIIYLSLLFVVLLLDHYCLYFL